MTNNPENDNKKIHNEDMDTNELHIKQMKELKKEGNKVYENDEIAISWEPELCEHAAECVKASPNVFKPAERPWVIIDGDTAENIAEAVAKCPTGALKFCRKNEK